MNDVDRSPSEKRSNFDPLDNGLAAAFGHPARAMPPQSSVLRALQARAKSKLGVHVDSAGFDDAPVRVTDEVRALRDPAGRYQMLGEIGRGGVGIVYKGRDQDLGRDVAMKVLKDEYATRADVLARFVEEAQIGGQLQHPGIVPVYELGLHAGERPYFAMKLIKGETLAAQLARRGDATQERRRLLGIFEQVCQTMAYAHARHVVHRDLKPANVMIGAFGEVQVVDWGFAKVLQRNVSDEVESVQVSQHSVIETARSKADSGSHSVVGSMMGTPAYMPPEQALGDIARVDERSDVFALGAILCEILTGDAPYREEDGDLVRQAATAQLDGAHERLAKCGADEALIALSKECLSPAQRARPASGAEVAERVGAYLTSVEERARQAQVRAAEARLRHRVTLMSAGAGVLVLALGASAWIWFDNQTQARRTAANQRLASAMNAASAARGRAQSSDRDMSLWTSAVSSGEQLAALAKGDDVDASARAEAQSLLTAVLDESRAAQAESDRRARDTAMLAQLELARIPADEDVRKNAIPELRRLDAAYGQAFATYVNGASLLSQSSEPSLASLRHGDIEVELAAALDHWGLVRDSLQSEPDAPDAAGTARIREVAMLLDANDAWRAKVRALLPNAKQEGARLRELAEHADFDALTAVGCRVLSHALWNAGEKEAAVTVLRRGQELHPQDFDLCFQLALRLELLDEPRPLEAVDTYRIAHAIRPELSEVLHRQVLAMEELRRHVDAERLSRVLVARDARNSHWLHHLGNAVSGQKRFDEAIAVYRKAVLLDPQNALLHGNLGANLEAQGELEEAIASLRRAIELDPNDVAVRTNLAIALSHHGELDEAIANFRRAIELDPKYVPARAELGVALYDQHKLDEAIASFRIAIELDPQNALALTDLGIALQEQGKLDEALAVLRKLTEMQPKDAEAHAYLGVALKDQGRLDEALASYRRATELDPNLVLAHRNLGIVLGALGRREEAIASYRRALELDPRETNALNHLGIALRSQGDTDGAIDCFERALELDSRSGPATLNLGTCFLDQGDLERARMQFRRAEELFAQEPSSRGREWSEKSRAYIAGVEQMLEVRGTSNEVLDGRGARSTDEWSAAVRYGYDRQRHRDVVALTENTLQNAPELIDDIAALYNSACSAALLAAGTDSNVNQAERVRVRELARVWLDHDVERWIAQCDQGEENAAKARDALKHALDDADFASVRAGAIEVLPDGERAAWRALWQRIETGASK